MANKPIVESVVCIWTVLFFFTKILPSVPLLFYLQGGLLNSHTAITALLTNLPYTTSSALGLVLLIVSMILYTHQTRILLVCVAVFVNSALSLNIQDIAIAVIPLSDISNILLLNSINKIHPPLLYTCLILLYFIAAPHYNFQSFRYTKYNPMSVNPAVTYVLQPLLVAIWFLLTFVIGAWWALQIGTWGGWWAWDISELLLLYTTSALCFYLHILHSKLRVKSMQATVTLMLIIGLLLWNLSSSIFYTNLHSFFSGSVLLAEQTASLRVGFLACFLKYSLTAGRVISNPAPRPYAPASTPFILVTLTLTLMLLFNTFSTGIALAALLSIFASLLIIYTRLSSISRSSWLSEWAHLVFLLFILKTLTSSQTPFSFSFDVLDAPSLHFFQLVNSLSEVSFMFKGCSSLFYSMPKCFNSCPEATNFGIVLLSDSSSTVGLLTDKTFLKKPGGLCYSGFYDDLYVFLI